MEGENLTIHLRVSLGSIVFTSQESVVSDVAFRLRHGNKSITSSACLLNRTEKNKYTASNAEEISLVIRTEDASIDFIIVDLVCHSDNKIESFATVRIALDDLESYSEMSSCPFVPTISHVEFVSAEIKIAATALPKDSSFGTVLEKLSGFINDTSAVENVDVPADSSDVLALVSRLRKNSTTSAESKNDENLYFADAISSLVKSTEVFKSTFEDTLSELKLIQPRLFGQEKLVNELSKLKDAYAKLSKDFEDQKEILDMQAEALQKASKSDNASLIASKDALIAALRDEVDKLRKALRIESSDEIDANGKRTKSTKMKSKVSSFLSREDSKTDVSLELDALRSENNTLEKERLQAQVTLNEQTSLISQYQSEMKLLQVRLDNATSSETLLQNQLKSMQDRVDNQFSTDYMRSIQVEIDGYRQQAEVSWAAAQALVNLSDEKGTIGSEFKRLFEKYTTKADTNSGFEFDATSSPGWHSPGFGNDWADYSRSRSDTAHKALVDTLRGEIEELKSTVDSQSNKLHEAEEYITFQEGRLAELQTRLDQSVSNHSHPDTNESDMALSALKDVINTQQSKLLQAAEHIKNQDSVVHNLSTEIEDLKSQIIFLKSQREDENSKKLVEQYKERLLAAADYVKVLKQQLESKESLSNTETPSSDISNELEEARATIAAYEEKLQQGAEYVKYQQEQLAAAEEELEKLRNQVSSAPSGDSGAELEEARATIAAYEEKLQQGAEYVKYQRELHAEVSHELDEANARVSNYETKLQQGSEYVKYLQEQINSLQSELESAHSSIPESSNLQHQVEELAVSNGELKEVNQKLREDLKTLSIHMDGVVQSYETQIAEYKANISNLNSKLNSYEQTINQMKNQVAILQGTTKFSDNSQQVKEMQSTIRRIQNDLENANALIEELRSKDRNKEYEAVVQQLIDFKMHYALVSAEAEDGKRQVVELRAKLNNSSKQIETLQTTLRERQKHIEELESKWYFPFNKQSKH